MRRVLRSKMERVWDQHLPGWRETGGWTYNVFCGMPFLYLHGKVPVPRIHAATRAVLAFYKPEVMYLYHDGIAGWKTRWKGNRGYVFTAAEELISFLEREIRFRDPVKCDNYNIIAEDGRWMITYSHEGDWFLFAGAGELRKMNEGIWAALKIPGVKEAAGKF